jgi:glycosyltransferase involved in cell wall biosynthesis
MKKRILYIATHRINRAPNQRYRFEQYIGSLTQNGFDVDISHLVSEKQDRYLYAPGHLLKKFLTIFILHKLIRLRDLTRIHKYDIILIAREALLSGSTFFERMMKKSGKPIVFDFDDAIWMLDVSPANQKFGWLKNPGKTASLINLANHVIAGNQYLTDYAARFNASVSLIPTTVDTEIYKPSDIHPKTDQICIGWSGSITTIPHFELIVPVLVKIKEKFGQKVIFKVIGDRSYYCKALETSGIAWTSESEVMELNTVDIGIMPLPDTEWAKGKCGLKGLVYMSMGIPTVMSAVGVNTDIIKDGQNGLLAYSHDEFFEKLCLLVESDELRKKLGKAGQQTVVQDYSTLRWKDEYVAIFDKILIKNA